jgi:hypothetical protein
MSWLRKNSTDIVILGVYTVLTLVLTWPLTANMSTTLAGDDVDVLINPWADWWTKKALTKGLDLYYTDYMFYPQGTSLVFHSFSHVNTAISLLLAPIVGQFPAYNVAILMTYVVSGFGMYLLTKYLTNCRPAAVFSGVVFAFHPYHLFQSSHPVLVTTQFIPLFVLAFMRMLHNTDAGRSHRLKQTLLAALWFLLTALSSWHLMLMLVGWATLYLLYVLLFERDTRTSETYRYVTLQAAIIILVVAPFLWPIVQEQLTADATYMAVDVEEGRGNDLLSFFTPTRLHPVFGPLVLEVNSRIGYTRNTPAYLGYVALGLALIGVITTRREGRFWWATGLLFFILSLGSQLKWEGVPLHTGRLPWAIPIISVLRHPLRLNSLLFLSLAVLVAYGSRWLHDRLALRSRPLAYLVLALLTGVLLFEYWVHPFPTTQPSYSPFLDELAQDEGDFAVADFPIGRQADKYYMFYQTIHDKRIIGGVVSRTPYDADAFLDANPLLGAMRNENVPDEYIRDRLAVLAAQNVRYVIVHKTLLDDERMENWQRWLINFPSPYYEDDMVIVYRTAPDLETDLLAQQDVDRLDMQLGDHIHLRGYRLNSDGLKAGDTLMVTLFWQSDSRLNDDYHVFVHLLDAERQLVAQRDGVPVQGERPTWSWWDEEVIQDEYVLTTERNLPPGIYTLSVGMYDLRTKARLRAVGPAGERLADDRVVLEAIKVDGP